jgi:acetyltransferase-like isoleucine patch superfamily enzyme
MDFFSKIKYFLIRAFGKLIPVANYASSVGRGSKIGAGTQLWKSSFGLYSYCGKSCCFVNTDVGSFCSIADHVVVGPMGHPIDFVSTSPVFVSGRNVLNKNFSCHNYSFEQRVFIGSDVWVGVRTIILPGVKIGHGSIIGAGSVVTKDVPPYTIFAGVPAKFIRNRFNQQVTDRLLSERWWEWDQKEIVKYSDVFNDPLALIARLDESRVNFS